MNRDIVWTGRGGRPWRLTCRGAELILESRDGRQVFAGSSLEHLTLGRSWFRPVLRVSIPGRATSIYRGLSRPDAKAIRQAISHARTLGQAAPLIDAVRRWATHARAEVRRHEQEQRWIPEEVVASLEASRPDAAEAHRIYQSVGHLLGREEKEAFALSGTGPHLREWIGEVNEWILQQELRTRRTFFDTIERSPLTEEQARAVACFDNRVHVIAAAGSGKTSVMVGRAAYAITRGFVAADRTLLLAFNKNAAEELQQRIDTRLRAAGIDPTGVRAATFHSFGLDVIGRATGRKPRVSPWVADGRDVELVARIVDDLRDSSPEFRYAWDLFRLVFMKAKNPADTMPDAWDADQRRTGIRTLAGDIVKSQGERIIADWLFLNGVDYRYEHPYAHDTADAEHSRYRPDFYYPTVDVWHEHWALDHHGNPPPEFTGYLEQMRWKRALHQQHGTTLIETTWASVMDRSGLTVLESELGKHGIELDWNPDRPVPGEPPVKHEDLVRLVRTFMTHVKSNSLTAEDLRARAGQNYRARLFLDLYLPIQREWDARLRAEECIDFEDMLVMAAEHLESGRYQSGYELVMVDEFQDASQARARLVQALVGKPGLFLLAVGDDWQSINRFAGADLGVLTDFAELFGRGPTLRLQTTFRCQQAVADAASAFIAKNPRQLKKQVRSAGDEQGMGVRIARVRSEEDTTAAISGFLNRIAGDLRAGAITANRGGRISVDVLGRYNFNRQLLPRRVPQELDVTFRTVHISKGLEADYVVIPAMTSGSYGFPSLIADDPVLKMVMADPDPFPYAEERRLLYVALTRARRGALLITPVGRESPFIAELLKDRLAHLDTQSPRDDAREQEAVRICPACGTGILVPRQGRYGTFLGCNTFPRCRGKARLPKN